MTDKIKDKLLGLVDDTDFDDLSAARLVDILADKLKEREAEIARLHGANARERQELEVNNFALREEYRRLSRDSARAWESAYPIFFQDDKGNVFQVTVAYQDVQMAKKVKGNLIMMQRIPPATADQLA